MAFGGFKETSETEETNENKESSLDNTDKRRNQILEIPDDYDDDFDSKLDSNEDDKKEDSSESQDNIEEKQGLFARIKGFLLKDKSESFREDAESKDMSKTPEESGKSRVESFKESIKAPSPEESKKYNEEHGYPDIPTERPKGGVERERNGEDPRWADSYDSNETSEDSDDTENN